MTHTQPTYLLRVGDGYETNADGTPREYQGKEARAALAQMQRLTHSSTPVRLERKNGPATLRYLATDTGAPIVGPNNVRICDMDCVDFYEITDNADTDQQEANVAAYEAQREAYAALFVAAPTMLDALGVALAGMIEVRDCVAMKGAAAVTKALLQQKIDRVKAVIDSVKQ